MRYKRIVKSKPFLADGTFIGNMKTIAIIGGGFCGAECARILDQKAPEDWKIMLFDAKDYFEFTPSVHKLITDLKYEKKIKVPYSKFLKRTQIITEKVISVTKEKILTEKAEYKFDYLVLSSGSNTQNPMFENTYLLKTSEDAKLLHSKILTAKSVVIIGSGLTGTETAGELCTKTDKKIMLIHSLQRIMERQPEKASKASFMFLHGNAVSIVLNTKALEIKDGVLHISNNETIEADCYIWCTGISPNSNLLTGFPLNEKGYLITEPTLNVTGLGHVFAGGDITSLKEEKCAQNAEYHGKIIAENIIRSIKGKKLIQYIPAKRVMVISLGDWYGILTYGNFVWKGLIPALLKKLIEAMVVWRYRYFS